jgi:ABC-2 type transport system ATP-binding protein
MTYSVAIRIENLHKHFGRREKKRVQAVKNLNLEIAAGQVYGFLGPNGAGKTTTIRMLLDLIRPNQGDVYLFGKHVRREREVLQRVGSLVEGASFYDFLTGRRNLEVFALTSNLDLPDSRFDEVLELVDMKERSARRVKGYSTGMKQRLGIAAAMLTNPDLVILDEPANGLDPHGIAEIRALTRRLADEFGKTVFLSSHQLGEVEQICDRVAIINQGELIREGIPSDLVSTKAQFRIRATPPEQALAVINGQWTSALQSDDTLLADVRYEDLPVLIEKLVKNNIKVYEVSPQRQSLEDYFLSVTEGENHHAG